MASTGVNVFRWSALGLGVMYGVYHQASISSRDRLLARKSEWEAQESLISQAKADFKRLNSPSDPSAPTSANASSKDDLDAFPWLQESK